MEQKSKSGEKICAVCTTMRVCDRFSVKLVRITAYSLSAPHITKKSLLYYGF